MFRVLKTFFLIAATLTLVTQASIAQEVFSLGKDSTKIHTEQIKIDFSSTNLLKSTQNTQLKDNAIQQKDPGEATILLSKEILVPVEDISPFLALGSRLIFGPPVDQLENIRFEIRHSTQMKQWSDWSLVEKDDHLTTRLDTLIGTLQYFPEDTEFIQFQITLPDSENGQVLQLRSLNLSFTSPGSTPPAKLDKIRQKSAKTPKNQSRFMDTYPMPDYATRTDWDCPDGQSPSGPVSLTNVTHQIVHHTAGANSSSDWPAVVRSIWDYHVNTNGWSDIGYNWLVDPHGVIYQGRGWINGNDEVQGAHFCGTNSNTMGVALMGNFEEVSPSSDALVSLTEMLAWKSDENGIDPVAQNYHSSSGLNLFTISGHRDGCSTLCPGKNLYVELPEIRENVMLKIGETPEPPDIPAGLTLKNNYPNPFSDETTITFSIGQPGNVRITIWDTAGKMVQKISDKFYEAQTHSEIWDATNFSSGVYFCRISYESQSMVQRMVLIR